MVELAGATVSLASVRRRWTGLAGYWSVLYPRLPLKLLPLLVRGIGAITPRSQWYGIAVAASGGLASLVRLTRPGLEDRSLQARLLNRLLALLSRSGKAYPIRSDISGWEVVEAALRQANGQGVVFCSAHVALVKVGIARLMESGVDLVSIAADPNSDGAIAVWGLSQRLPALAVDSSVLLKAKSTLRGGRSIAVMLDKGLGKQYSPNMFKLVQRVGGRVVFLLADLDEHGVTQVRFLEAPDPACATDAGIQKNLMFLGQEVYRILGSKMTWIPGAIPEPVQASLVG